MTMNPAESHTASDPTLIPSLLLQRATLQEWLGRLEAEGSGANPRVVERVRADYQQRLRLVLDELGQHLGGLRQQRAALAESLEEADFRAGQAEEELEEARLRHRIGELADRDWSERRPALEDAVTAMADRRQEVQGELDRLDDILRQVEEGTVAADPVSTVPAAAAPPPPPAPAPAAARIDPEPDDSVYALDAEIAEEPGPAPTRTTFAAGPFAAPLGSEPIVDPEPEEDRGRDFLEELDRAMAEGNDPEPRAKMGVRCGECGYTNDAGAWYCGVCGVDLK